VKPENFVWNSNFEGVANQSENAGVIMYSGFEFSFSDTKPINDTTTSEIQFAYPDFSEGIISGSPVVSKSGIVGLFKGVVSSDPQVPYALRLSHIKELVTALGPKKYWGVNDNSDVTPNTPPPAEGSPEAGQYPLPQMVFIPGGSFQMGDPFDEGGSEGKASTRSDRRQLLHVRPRSDLRAVRCVLRGD
jgi:hypothetical protein